ncbi:CPBP family glutamic-type intramembrane protease [Spirosoma validum]|uniref:CPBP family intramembrane metalloprotease n=1 Tax=Spirosoma validum TaxID=2771355 RepID=A0A927GEW3_9BACT|nr:CPBP family glutamic-type intramembrane protease [Spirosoma validum]MBD2755242.1 CPBP family intramembrane metalloprotease [Spirosoma validum]
MHMLTAVKLSRPHIAQVDWKAVTFFYALACGISYGLHFLPNLNEGILPRHNIFTYGLGPILAALLTRRFFPKLVQTVSVLGSSPAKAILFMAIPIVLSTFIGIQNRAGQNEHVYGLLLGMSGLLYGFVEETGWRGFLQDALRPLPTFWRVMLIGLMHAGWHLTFLSDLSNVCGPRLGETGAVVALVLMAWGFGALIDTTKSLLVVACAHELMNIVGHPVAIAVTLLIWIWLTRNWKKQLVFQVGQKTIAMTLVVILFGGYSAFAQSDSLTYGAIPKEEIVPGKADNFRIFDEAFYQNQLFLLGESHGVQKPQEIDFELLKHLNQKAGIRYYIAEVDATKAFYMNQYLQTGDDATLLKVFRSWIDEKAQWANKDFIRKIQKIRALNQTLPKNRQIQFVGIDRIQDKPLAAERLTQLIAGQKLAKSIRPLADSLAKKLTQSGPDSVAATIALTWLNDWQRNEGMYRKTLGSNAEALRDLLINVGYLKTIRSRETTIFTNFKTILPSLNNEKLYGFWGFFHVLQSPPLKSTKPFACLVKESGIKVVSITCSYLDCYSMLPTTFLPPFWQDKGKTYTRLNKFNNDSELMHSEGIEAMRAATRPNSLTLFALDRAGSFARQMPIRIKYSPFMPQKIEFDPQRPMTDYFQYIVLVRDSDMTEPIVP